MLIFTVYTLYIFRKISKIKTKTKERRNFSTTNNNFTTMMMMMMIISSVLAIFFWEVYFILSCHLSFWLHALCPLSLADVLFLCLLVFYCLGMGCWLRWPQSASLCSVSRCLCLDCRREVKESCSHPVFFDCRGSHQETLKGGRTIKRHAYVCTGTRNAITGKLGWIINKLIFECVHVHGKARGVAGQLFTGYIGQMYLFIVGQRWEKRIWLVRPTLTSMV